MKQKLLAGISAGLLTAAALTPTAAAKTVPVTVDGQLLSDACYLAEGVTAVPLRALCDALGGWQLTWDGASQTAQAVSGAFSVTACADPAAVTVDDVAYGSSGVFLRNGRTYVPLRTVCESLGLSVSWDSALGGAAVTTGSGDEMAYSEEDLYWLSRIISAESRGESLLGQIAVGNVVLNRVASDAFPNTIRDVIFDRQDGVQFEPVSNGTVYGEPTAQSVAAAKAVLAGSDAAGRCLYFYAPALSKGAWINANRTYYTTIGCHRFYL